MKMSLVRSLVLVFAAFCLTTLLPGHAQAGQTYVSTWEELERTLTGAEKGERVVLTNHIEMEGVAAHDCPLIDYPVKIQAALLVPGEATLDFNGYTLTMALSPADGIGSAGIAVLPGGDLTLSAGNLIVDGNIALINAGGRITAKAHFYAEADDVGLLDTGAAYTQILGASLVGKTLAGYHQMGYDMRIVDGFLVGGQYGYLGGPSPKKGMIEVGYFRGGSFALFNQGPSPLREIILYDAGIDVNHTTIDLDDTTKALEGEVSIYVSPTPSGPATLRQVVFTIGERTYYVNNNDGAGPIPMTLDVPPYINYATSRTMLPVRFVGESLGMEVSYDDATQRVFLASEGQVLVLTLGSNFVLLNDSTYFLASPPALVEGRTMLPIGEIADLLGLSREDPSHPQGYLMWIPEDRSVLIQRYVS